MYNIKKIVVCIATIFVILSSSSIAYAIKSDFTTLGPHLIVPDDHSTIQSAINAANPGETIFVRSGFYQENIIIDKKDIYLLGEDKLTTIIDGGKTTKDAINVSASGVTIQEFTIQNAWNTDRYLWDLSGIRIQASNVTIIDNVIKSNRLGINIITYAYDLVISDNLFFDDGILLPNYCYSFQMTKNDSLHTITNNKVNNKPLYYFKNQEDFVVPSNAGQVILANCSNFTVKDLNITNTDFPIILAYSSKCIVENNTIDKTDGELILFNCDNCTVQNNTVSNSLHGICLDYESTNNTVKYNEVYNNWIGISALTDVKNNIIYDNKIHDNFAGVEITTYSDPKPAHDNIISENDIYNNSFGVQISHGSFKNTVTNNSIHNNKLIGVYILRHSKDNTITYNTFKKNTFSAIFTDLTKNKWDHNYWNRLRISPKIIFGFKMINKLPIIPCWINVDWHPAKQPTI